MRLYGEISKVEPQDDGTIKVYGIASSPALDAHGEVVTSDAMRAAIPDYLKFPTIREMHDPQKAAGRTVEIGVEDDGKTSIVAHVVDPIAITKVKNNVYAGFSIGGRIKKRNTDDRTIIEGLELVEVSLVDRPSCPEAVVSLWKSDAPSDANTDDDLDTATGESLDKIAAEQFDVERADGETDASLRAFLSDMAKRKFSAKERDAAAASGAAMPDGGYPIETKEDLRNAIQAYGRAKNKAAVKRHIKARAKALGAESELPDDWQAKKADEPGDDMTKDAVLKTEETEPPADDIAKVEHAEALTEAEKAASDADAIMKSVMATLERLEKGDAETETTPRPIPPALVAGMELRKCMWDLRSLGSLLTDLSYIIFSADWEASNEGDKSPVPAKLRVAFNSLAEAYKAMSDEEIAELVASVNGTELTKAVISLGDLAKIEGELPAEQAEALTGAIRPLLTKGLALVDPSAPDTAERLAKIAEADDRLAKAENAVERLTAENTTLLKSVSDMTVGLAALRDRVEKLANDPLPSKTAGSILARAVSKEEDVGRVNERPAFTEEDVQKVLAALPADDRAMLLIKAAHQTPNRTASR